VYASGAPYYLRGRPPYSAQLPDVLRAELGLDGTGVLVDVGCGPGVLVVQLASAVETRIGIDPEPAMLEEAARHAAAHDVAARWIGARAEDLPSLQLPPARLVTFGQSLHWTDQALVIDAVYDLLEPGGGIAVISHDIEAAPRPSAGPAPPIPHDDMHALIRRHLANDSAPRPAHMERFQDAVARSRFRTARQLQAPGRTDLVRDVDGVIAGFLSMSFAAPDLFGAGLDAFLADARSLLEGASPTGRFWDWPGDTAVVLAVKS
jgi:ubiquinone/menaquinone biosynthesis C-methylase UbiE